MGYFIRMKTAPLEDLKNGQLVFATLGKYRGRGPRKVILYEARPQPNLGFSYGTGRVWVASPSALMGMVRSDRKAAASRVNGRKGGRPREDLATEAWAEGLM